MKDLSLRQLQRDGVKLNENHIKAFHDVLISRMRSPQRKRMIQYINSNNIFLLADEWYGSRFHFTADGRCTYYAGQDYPGEISTIREDIIKKVEKGNLR